MEQTYFLPDSHVTPVIISCSSALNVSIVCRYATAITREGIS
jgi:hypothetical protein